MSTAQHLPALHDAAYLSERVAQLLIAIPCADTMAQLSAIDPFSLSASDRIDYLAALERQDGWLYALKQRAITAVAGLTPTEGGGPLSGVDEAEREDVSTALRLAPATAQSRIDIARTLVNNLPQTCAALATGEISSAHATVIARETAAAIRDGAAESTIFSIEERALAYAEFHTPGQVASHLRTQIAKLTPEEFEETVTRAQSLRRVSCYNDGDGMATVVAILPAADAQIVMNSIEAFILRQTQLDEQMAQQINQQRYSTSIFDVSNTSRQHTKAAGANAAGANAAGANAAGANNAGTNAAGANNAITNN